MHFSLIEARAQDHFHRVNDVNFCNAQKQVMTRNKELDGLRGLAAMAVALGHCNTATTGLDVLMKSALDFSGMTSGQIIGRLGHVLFPAEAAVIIFFVMSGYVLWGSLLRRESDPRVSAVPYVISRTYRLLPASIISAVILGLLVDAPAKDVSQNAFLVSYSLNGVLWSLQVEVVGSILVFFLYATTAKNPRLIIFMMLAAGIAAYLCPHPLLRYLPTFIFGISIHYLPPRFFLSPLVAIAAYCLLVSADLLFHRGIISKTVLFLSAWIVVASVVHLRPKFLTIHAVQFLGNISYPLYLSHAIGMTGAGYFLAKFNWSLQNGFGMFSFLVIVSLVFTIPLAWFIHVLVEKPGMMAGASISREVSNWIQKRLHLEGN